MVALELGTTPADLPPTETHQTCTDYKIIVDTENDTTEEHIVQIPQDHFVETREEITTINSPDHIYFNSGHVGHNKGLSPNIIPILPPQDYWVVLHRNVLNEIEKQNVHATVNWRNLLQNPKFTDDESIQLKFLRSLLLQANINGRNHLSNAVIKELSPEDAEKVFRSNIRITFFRAAQAFLAAAKHAGIDYENLSETQRLQDLKILHNQLASDRTAIKDPKKLKAFDTMATKQRRYYELSIFKKLTHIINTNLEPTNQQPILSEPSSPSAAV